MAGGTPSGEGGSLGKEGGRIPSLRETEQDSCWAGYPWERGRVVAVSPSPALVLLKRPPYHHSHHPRCQRGEWVMSPVKRGHLQASGRLFLGGAPCELRREVGAFGTHWASLQTGLEGKGREERKADKTSDVSRLGNESNVSPPPPFTLPLPLPFSSFSSSGGGVEEGRAGAGRLLPPHAAPGLAAPPAGSPCTPCPSSCHVCGLGREGESVRQEKPSALEPRRRARTAEAPGTGSRAPRQLPLPTLAARRWARRGTEQAQAGGAPVAESPPSAARPPPGAERATGGPSPRRQSPARPPAGRAHRLPLPPSQQVAPRRDGQRGRANAAALGAAALGPRRGGQEKLETAWPAAAAGGGGGSSPRAERGGRATGGELPIGLYRCRGQHGQFHGSDQEFGAVAVPLLGAKSASGAEAPLAAQQFGHLQRRQPCRVSADSYPPPTPLLRGSSSPVSALILQV